MSRCNLLLSRNDAPPADVLIVGSSRSGVALDAPAMQIMLEREVPGASVNVERLALGNNPLRVNHALLENYLELRGAPRVVVLEIMFMTQRSVERLQHIGLETTPEHYIFQRDINLMSYGQIMRLPSVAMPFTEDEGWLNRLRFRLRGTVLRTGALIYQFARKPGERWDLASCDKSDWTREPSWPASFSFRHGDFDSNMPLAETMASLEKAMSDRAAGMGLKPWQKDVATGGQYPYDFASPYRQGEVALLDSMLEMTAKQNIPVVLLPLPLYGYEVGREDLGQLSARLPDKTQILNVYGQVRGELDKFWYDDGHIEAYPAGALTTAIVARHLLGAGFFVSDTPGDALD
ncbi:MAG: hypothetical protein AAFX56_13665 [Pseudomonadota bacterium]